MTVDTVTFYPSLPLFGIRLTEQWGRFRTNFDSLAPLGRSIFADIAEIAGNSELAGLSQGELGFRNRYRVFYDKAAEEWKIQYNNATEAEPNFVDYVRIRNSDGRFIVEGTGGLQSASGFYNFDYLTVKEDPAGGFSKSGADTLKFNKNDGFYLTFDSESNPLVNFETVPSRITNPSAALNDVLVFDGSTYREARFDRNDFYLSTGGDGKLIISLTSS